MARLKKYMKLYRRYSQMNPKVKESYQGDQLWDELARLRERLSETEQEQADNLMERV